MVRVARQSPDAGELQMPLPLLLLLFNALLLLLTLHIMPPAMANGSKCIPPVPPPVSPLVLVHWNPVVTASIGFHMRQAQSTQS
jgi:hypothetical protein